MRALLKIFLFCIGLVAFLLVTAFAWFFLYSRGLPDTSALARFAPAATTSVSDPCLKAASVAIPYESVGGNLRSAFSAVEVAVSDPGVFTTMYEGFTGKGRLHRATLSVQISRTMLCTPSKMLNRLLDEIRTAVQLERHFSRPELFMIYANRAHFADNLIGVQATSQYFFHKNPDQLSVAEAALLAGLAKALAFYSPIEHPDRALQRRNEVIDAMLQVQSVNALQAASAKMAGLGIAR